MNKYSDDDLLKILKDFYNKNGRNAKRREIPQASIMRARFGSFNGALLKAGLYVKPEPQKEVLVESLRGFYEREGYVPKANDTYKFKDLYDAKTYMRVFGAKSWGDVLEKVGMPAYLKVSELVRDKDKAKVEIVRFVKENKITTVEDYRKFNGSGLPSSTYITQHFGWDEIVIEAGLRAEMSERNILRVIFEFIEDNERTPSLAKLAEIMMCSDRAITNIVGAYNTFLTKNGIELAHVTPVQNELSREELRQLYIRLSEKHGAENGLTCKMMDELKEEGCPPSHIFMSNFGTINSLRLACGYAIKQNGREVWTRDMIIESLCEIYRDNNGRVKNSFFKEAARYPPLTSILKKMNSTSMKGVWEFIEKMV